MINISQAKLISKFLSTRLKDKGVKQSEVLELLAQMENYKDWNTFLGVENNQEKQENWTGNYYIHIDNGGYFFSYDTFNKVLKVETSFFGYVATEFKIKMTIKEVEKMVYSFKQYWNGAIIAKKGNGWEIKNGLSIFSENNGKILMTFYTPKNIDPCSILEKMIEEIKLKNGI